MNGIVGHRNEPRACLIDVALIVMFSLAAGAVGLGYVEPEIVIYGAAGILLPYLLITAAKALRKRGRHARSDTRGTD